MNAIVIDDDKTVCAILEAMLESRDTQIVDSATSLESGAKLIESLAKESTRIDVVFLDGNLGVELSAPLIPLIHENLPATKICLMSSDSLDDLPKVFRESSTDYFLTKPFTSATLEKALSAFS